jgi:hypothetical protein
MDKLNRNDLFSLEKYTEMRSELRAQAMTHKQDRRLPIGPNLTLYFEDRLTIQYQIQEMLRIEKIFEAEGIEEELAAYNPLIPDGGNWKATMMIEFDDSAERARQLARMVNIENNVWLRINSCEPVRPVADEDLERTNQTKTSAVHFLRFELTDEMIDKLKNGAILSAGVDHEAYHYKVEQVPDNIRKALISDLD